MYRKIVSRIPILCVDLLIWRDGKLLLVKRRNHPLRGWWWVVGGRILFGEDPEDAIHRKAWEEVGLKVSDPRMIGFYSDVYPKSKQGPPCHGISLVYVCKGLPGDVKLDRQSVAYKWADSIPPRLTSKIRRR